MKNTSRGEHGSYLVERLLKGGAVQASVLTLEPGEEVSDHLHSHVTDYMFVLEGTLSVKCEARSSSGTFNTGDVCRVSPGVVHATLNRGQTVCRFLLVQVGEYDFVPRSIGR